MKQLTISILIALIILVGGYLLFVQTDQENNNINDIQVTMDDELKNYELVFKVSSNNTHWKMSSFSLDTNRWSYIHGANSRDYIIDAGSSFILSNYLSNNGQSLRYSYAGDFIANYPEYKILDFQKGNLFDTFLATKYGSDERILVIDRTEGIHELNKSDLNISDLDELSFVRILNDNTIIYSYKETRKDAYGEMNLYQLNIPSFESSLLVSYPLSLDPRFLGTDEEENIAFFSLAMPNELSDSGFKVVSVNLVTKKETNIYLTDTATLEVKLEARHKQITFAEKKIKSSLVTMKVVSTDGNLLSQIQDLIPVFWINADYILAVTTSHENEYVIFDISKNKIITLHENFINGFTSLGPIGVYATGTDDFSQSVLQGDERAVSMLRSTELIELEYEINSNGQNCLVIDLNNYFPTQNQTTKIFEWLIRFPDDDCVITRMATNLIETLGESLNENIQGTNYRRIIVNYK